MTNEPKLDQVLPKLSYKTNKQKIFQFSEFYRFQNCRYRIMDPYNLIVSYYKCVCFTIVSSAITLLLKTQIYSNVIETIEHNSDFTFANA